MTEEPAGIEDLQSLPFNNPDLPIEERVKDLVSRMTVKEKASQLCHRANEIKRLGVPEYNWWNECLHGVARAGIATVFPQAIGMAATFNVPLIFEIAEVISTEARAKHHEFIRKGEREIYKGLTMWSPNINIFRDPRWGRGQETYGEDPYLTGRMGVAFIKGLQGDDPKYLKCVATPKHYAVHSGPEKDRHHFDAVVSQKDLWETYLPHFKESIVEARAESIMTAYNAVNGEPCIASPTLIQKILREQWGFQGYVVSDCGNARDLYQGHKVVKTAAEASTLAFSTGLDLICGWDAIEGTTDAAVSGMMSEEVMDRCLTRLFTARFKLGMFDPPERVPFAQIPFELNDCEEHRALALRTARESMVLLKNDGLLPLGKNLKTVAVIGPNADVEKTLWANYCGDASRTVTPLQGIHDKATPAATVKFAQGCELTGGDDSGIAEAVELAKNSDVAILVLGLSIELEGEEGKVANSDGGDDRPHLNLPGLQQQLLEAVHATGTPTALVLINGSPMTIGWADENIPAILEAWYPGEEGGTAIADVLWGDYNPAGRLPVTFPKSLDQLPPFTDYSMKGRTYRYMTEEPLYPFGYGLSYTTFEYSNLKYPHQQTEAGQEGKISVDVRNSGERAGDEIVQFYISHKDASVETPIRELRGVERVSLQPGETKTVAFTLTDRQMAIIDNDGKAMLEPGEIAISIGGQQPHTHTQARTGCNVVEGAVRIATEHKAIHLEY
jgi:beta-glucosidase